jgi:hypothetical protein
MQCSRNCICNRVCLCVHQELTVSIFFSIVYSVMASSMAHLLRLPGLLIVAALLLEISAELCIELGRIMQKHWEEQQLFKSTDNLASLDSSMIRSASLTSMKRVASGNSLNRINSTPDLQGAAAGTAAEPMNDNTFVQRLLRGVTTILRSRLLMAIFTYNALYASTTVLLSFQRAALVANRKETTTTEAQDHSFSNTRDLCQPPTVTFMGCLKMMKQKSNEFNKFHTPGQESYDQNQIRRGNGTQKRFHRPNRKLNYAHAKGGSPSYGRSQQNHIPNQKGGQLPYEVWKLMSNENKILWDKMKDETQNKPSYGQQYSSPKGNSNTRKANSLTSLVSATARKPIISDKDQYTEKASMTCKESDSKEHVERAIGIIWKPTDGTRKQMLKRTIAFDSPIKATYKTGGQCENSSSFPTKKT